MMVRISGRTWILIWADDTSAAISIIRNFYVAPIIRKTHFYGLDLIPANLKLYNPLNMRSPGISRKIRTSDIID